MAVGIFSSASAPIMQQFQPKFHACFDEIFVRAESSENRKMGYNYFDEKKYIFESIKKGK